MEKPVVGDVVVIAFPQTDLASGKRRPALVLVDLKGEDLILCQITSKAKHDGYSVGLGSSDFETGKLPMESFIRPNRLFTASWTVLISTVGRVKPSKLDEALTAVSSLFRRSRSDVR